MRLYRQSLWKAGMVLCMVVLCAWMGFKASAAGYDSEVELYKGQKVTFSISASYSSMNTKVATVTQKGQLTGKKVGTATILAKVRSDTYRIKVTVVPTKKTYKVEVGKSLTISSGGWNYTIGNGSSKAVLSKKGKQYIIKGKKEGGVLLKAAKGKKHKYYKLQIVKKGSLKEKSDSGKSSGSDANPSEKDPDPYEVVDVPSVIGRTEENASSILEQLGLVVQISGVYDSDYETGYVTDQSIAPDASVVKGSTIVIFVCQGRKPEKNELSGVTLNRTTISSQKIGETVNLSVTAYTPEDAKDRSLTWTSSNSSVASVSGSDQGATVTVKGYGTAVIQAKSSSDIVVGTCDVTATDPNPALTKVELSQSSMQLEKGKTGTLSIRSFTPSNGDAGSLLWSSTSTAVASVSGNGKSATVTAKGSGTATIQVKNSSGTVVGSCTVKVSEAAAVTPSSVVLNRSSLSFTKNGETGTLSVTSCSPGNADPGTLTWSTASSSVATVSGSGKTATVKATASKSASTVIYVKNSNGATVGTCTVNITIAAAAAEPQTISFNVSELTIESLNTSRRLVATLTPANAPAASVTWNSSNPSVASVTEGIVVTTGRGECTITASLPNGRTASCKVYSILLGDIDNDGKVTSSDSYELIKYLNKTISLTPYQMKAADVNRDGVVDDNDREALRALQ